MVGYQVFDAVWVPDKSLRRLGLKREDIEAPSNFFDPLGSVESYIVNDPLNICKDNLEDWDLVWQIYGTYFPFSQGIYAIWEIWEEQRKIIDDGLKITTKWLEQLKEDLIYRENLYELFSQTHQQYRGGAFYTREEFYNIITPFIQFYIRYWESVETIMREAQWANDDQFFVDKYHELNHLLDRLKSSKCYFNGLNITGMREEEIFPYVKSFTFRWAEVVMQKNTNMSQARLRELYVLQRIKSIRRWVRESVSNARYERGLRALIINPNDPRYQDLEIAF